MGHFLDLTRARGVWRSYVLFSRPRRPSQSLPEPCLGGQGPSWLARSSREGSFLFSKRKLCSGREISTLYFHRAQL